MSAGDNLKPPSNSQENTQSRVPATESKSATVPSKVEGDDKSSNTAQPLAPPPKPSQQGNPSQPSQTPDYFGGSQNNTHFSLEPNPFEQSFGNPSSTETPGKTGGLPSVASLTSPNPLGPGAAPNLPDSLRAGPLSPAMLQGPVNSNTGYFDQEFRNQYPTPTESSVRTGLTPGGGGSMFPAPSPGTAAIFQNLGGGVTPGTAEFQRVAATAARQKGHNQNNQSNATSSQNMPKQEYQPAQQQGRQDPFAANQQEHEAVNSLYMLAQPNNNRTGANANQFAANSQQQISQNLANMNIQQRMQAQQQEQSPTTRNNGSIDMGHGNDEDDDGDEEKPTTRSKGKKGSASKGGAATNGRRKADETPSKTPAKKRSRGNNGSANDMDDDSDDAASIKNEDMQTHPNGKKMTDEEKRKNFLERNRVAALKCRQRKKQWLANLQTKVEIFTQENDALTQQCSQLREEIINLKTLLIAHKDCPVSHQQGLGGQAMAQFMGNPDPGANPGPYSMLNQGNIHMAHMQGQAQGMQQGMQPGQGVQRR